MTRARWIGMWYEYMGGSVLRRWPPWQKLPRGTMLNRSHPLARGLAASAILNEYGGGVFFHVINELYALPSGITWDGNGLYNDETGYIDLGTDLPTVDTGTIVCRVKPNFNWDTDDSYVILGGVEAGGYFRFEYTGWAPEEWYLLYQGNYGSSVGLFSNEGYSSDAEIQQWHNLAASWDVASGAKLYVGNNVTSTTDTTNSFNSTSWEFLDYDNGKEWLGWIEYFHFYNRVLTAAEIQQLHSEPYGMFL